MFGRTERKTVAEKSRRKESDRGATGFRKPPRRLFIVIKLHEADHLLANSLNALMRSNRPEQKLDIPGQNRRGAGEIQCTSAFRAMFRNQANPINIEERILPLPRARTGRSE